MRTIQSTLIVLAVDTASAAGPPAGWEPVDQAVGDLDPLSHSMRQLPPGLRAIGEQTSLFRVQTNSVTGSSLQGTTYYRVGTGFRARFDRPEYLVLVGRRHFDKNIAPRFDGEFVELVPPNTVYDLTPLVPFTETRLRQRDEAGIDQWIDHRLDTRIDGRVAGRVAGAGDVDIRHAPLLPIPSSASAPRQRGRYMGSVRAPRQRESLNVSRRLPRRTFPPPPRSAEEAAKSAGDEEAPKRPGDGATKGP